DDLGSRRARDRRLDVSQSLIAEGLKRPYYRGVAGARAATQLSRCHVHEFLGGQLGEQPANALGGGRESRRVIADASAQLGETGIVRSSESVSVVNRKVVAHVLDVTGVSPHVWEFSPEKSRFERIT